MKTIVLASNNENKLVEMKRVLAPFNLEIKTLKELGVSDPEETGKSFEENALVKARAAFLETGLPAIADDSGFCIDALHDFPGLVSKRFAETVGGYNQAAAILNSCLGADKKAHFTTCIAFVFKKDEKVFEKTFSGHLNGKFIYPGRGTNGFGYCPYFIPDSYSLTLAELSDKHRMKINHRAIALNKFIHFLNSVYTNSL